MSRGAQPEAKKSTGQFLTRTKKPELSARESIQKNIDGWIRHQDRDTRKRRLKCYARRDF